MSTSNTSTNEANVQLDPQFLTDCAHAKPSQILSPQELSVLNQRSNLKGLMQLAGHLAIMGISGYLWATSWGNWLVAFP